MSPSLFARSARALGTDRSRRSLLSIGLAVALLLAWTGWFLLAPVAVYAESSSAHVVLDRSAHPIEAPRDGRLASIECDLGESVREGAILLTLDTEELRMRLDEEQVRADSFQPQLEALSTQLEALAQARQDAKSAAEAAVREAESTMASLVLSADLADEEHERLHGLLAHGGASEFQVSKARIEAEKLRLEIVGFQTARERVVLDQRVLDNDRAAAIEELRRESRRLAGERHAAEASIARMEHEIREHTIRAPTDGVLGELADLERGSVVSRGLHLATVVSPGHLLVAADFAPEVALARIWPGQPGRVRLDGFPWSEYGTLPVRVASVASEIRDGRVRVELEILEPSARIPIQHALPGTVEVVVDTVTPFRLALRRIGRRLSEVPAGAAPEAAP